MIHRYSIESKVSPAFIPRSQLHNVGEITSVEIEFDPRCDGAFYVAQIGPSSNRRYRVEQPNEAHVDVAVILINKGRTEGIGHTAENVA